MTRLFFGPFGLRVVLVALILSLALGWLVWARVDLLRNGAEVTLKTAPVDPRDLFRGHYVVLSYDISRLDPRKLQGDDHFSRGMRIFVTLRRGEDGFWHAVALHRRLPKVAPGEHVITGQVRHVAPAGGELFVTYGIETYFVPKARAQALENLQRGDTEAVRALQRQLAELNKKPLPVNESERKAREAEREALSRRLAEARRQARQSLAVLVRLSPYGEAAISGLRIGDQILREAIF